MHIFVADGVLTSAVTTLASVISTWPQAIPGGGLTFASASPNNLPSMVRGGHYLYPHYDPFALEYFDSYSCCLWEVDGDSIKSMTNRQFSLPIARLAPSQVEETGLQEPLSVNWLLIQQGDDDFIEVHFKGGRFWRPVGIGDIDMPGWELHTEDGELCGFNPLVPRAPARELDWVAPAPAHA